MAEKDKHDQRRGSQESLRKIRTASIAPAIPPAVNWVANPTGFFSAARDMFNASGTGLTV